MSGLNIEALRLTNGEMAKLFHARGAEGSMADAQLAKALYGLKDWIHEEWWETEAKAEYIVLSKLIEKFESGLKQANIERPTAGKAG